MRKTLMDKTLLAIHDKRRVSALDLKVADVANTDLDTVSLAVQEIVGGENSSDPMSDHQLAKQLEARGIKISRRTVTQIRQHVKIPSARQRRAAAND